MDVPGRWAGGFRAWDDDGVYLATGRGAVAGSAAAARRAAAARAGRPTGSRSAATSSGGLHRTARSIESTVRQRDALVTLGTLAAGLAHEINNPAAAAARAVDDLGQTCDALLSRAGPARPRRHHAPPSSPPSTTCGGGRPPRPGPLDALALGRPRERPRRLARPARRRRSRGRLAPTARRPAGSTAGGASGRTAVLGDRALAPGLEWVSATISARDPARRRSRSPPAGSPSWSRRCGPTRSSTGPRASAPTSRGAREHAGDARPQAPAAA